jgi:nicotinamide-nucleotide amidase
MSTLAEEVVGLARRKGLRLAVVESATGGLISHLITNVPGSSDVYQGSVTSYSNQAKVSILGVSAESIQRHGAVSPQVAEEMARGGRELLQADICLADTGIAGPSGGSAEKPVGLFYLGLSHKGSTFHRRHLFTGSREENKRAAAEAALGWAKEYLEGLP